MRTEVNFDNHVKFIEMMVMIEVIILIRFVLRLADVGMGGGVSVRVGENEPMIC